MRIVLEALKEEKTINEIGAEENLNPNQIRNWRRELIERGSEIFEEARAARARAEREREREAEIAKLHETIGRLTVERDWLKKKSSGAQGSEYEKKHGRR
jgi:transposase-like protein